jgi:hypothetical protein
VVLYGCETWFLILREEHRLRVLENRVLRRIFGLKRNEVTGEWRVESSSEFGIEPSGSMKCWETIEWPNIQWPLE